MFSKKSYSRLHDSLVDLDEKVIDEIADLQDELENRYVGLYSPDRPPINTCPFIDSHIRVTCSRLHIGYVRCYQVLDDSPRRDWFKQTASSLADFAKTFSAKSPFDPVRRSLLSLKTAVGLPGIAFLLGATGLVTYATEVFWNCYCKGLTFSVFVAPAYFWLTLINGFSMKRKMFLEKRKPRVPSLGEGRLSLYELEHALLGRLSEKKPVEVQWDVLGWLAIALDLGVGGFLLRDLVLDEVVILYMAGAGVAFFISLLVLARSFRRPWAWSSNAAD